jgi:hypothetical protein
MCHVHKSRAYIDKTRLNLENAALSDREKTPNGDIAQVVRAQHS